MRGKPSPEARLLTLAIANRRGHGLRAHNTEAKVMRPNEMCGVNAPGKHEPPSPEYSARIG